jgi:hypothetical protein
MNACRGSRDAFSLFDLDARQKRGQLHAPSDIPLYPMDMRAGYLSQYSVWLRAGRPGNRGSIPGRGERIYPLASVSRMALGPIQPRVQWVPEVLSSAKARPGRDAKHSPPPSAENE